MNNLVKVGMIDMSKHPKHLLINSPTAFIKLWRESTFLSNPVAWLLCAWCAWGRSERAGAGSVEHGGCGGLSLGWEDILVIGLVLDPVENKGDVVWGRKRRGALVRIEPFVIESRGVRVSKCSRGAARR